MSKVPNGQKRKADVVGNAVLVKDRHGRGEGVQAEG
jgi:hypothetical protein